jgi:hypothetical protein
MGIEGAAQPHDGAAQRQRLQLEGEDVFADHRRRHLILADGPQHPSPGGANAALDGDVHRPQDHQHDAQVEVVVVLRLHPSPQRLRQPGEAAGPVGEPALVVEDQADRLGDADGGDGQVILAQPEGGQADEQGQQSRHRRGAQQAAHERQVQPD